MSGLKIIKNRIGSVKNTRKITRAMKMVAAARLKRAQDRITALRPYAVKTSELLGAVAASVGEGGEEIHPLLSRREENRVLLVVMTSDRGLAGAFNASINKAGYKLWKRLEEDGKEVSFATVGRKGNEFFNRRGAHIVHNFTEVLDDLNAQSAGEVGRYVIDQYIREEIDSAYLLFNEFVSPMTQIVRAQPVLPVKPTELGEKAPTDPIYEPDRDGLLQRLLPMYVETQAYRALLESVASEHGARMTAMDNATRNASDMIDKLTLQYNRARQAAITKELMEIIGGAEALKG